MRLQSPHANKGRSLELTVQASTGNLLELVKVPNGVRYKAGGGTFPVPSPVDYLGLVRATGRAICFDAKKCALKKAFPIGNRDHFPAHQRDFLIRFGEAGAVSGLLVESEKLGRYLWMDWKIIRECEGKPSVPWEGCGGMDYLWIGWRDLGPNSHAIKFGEIDDVAPPLPTEAQR